MVSTSIYTPSFGGIPSGAKKGAVSGSKTSLSAGVSTTSKTSTSSGVNAYTKTSPHSGVNAYTKKSPHSGLNVATSQPSNGTQSSSGSGITTGTDAGVDSLTGGESDGSSDGSDSGSSGTTSPLLEGSMSFEELIKEICDGIDLIFVCKRSTVVVSDYESIYAEAKYLRDNYHDSVQAEDIALWQLEDGTYELEVSEYGFYNTVIIKYKNGTVKESYEDLVRVYGEVPITYTEKKLNKTSAIMKAKAYLAAHVRDFEMSVKANLLHDADIDIGDIVTLENPQTMRDQYRKDKENRDPEYFFVTANSISWDGEGPLLNSIELRYGAKSPDKKEVPESGTGGYSGGESNNNSNVDSAIDEVGKLAEKISYSGACQTHDCVQSKKTGDCHGMSDYIACELKTRGVDTQIKQYATSYAGNHRSVLYKDTTGSWKRFPYRSYSIDQRFRDTDGVNKGSDINSTC